ncbi:hypothetical protein [Paraburkholderia sp. MM5482-R1]|uniref:hypothetical protein n=1 Tax=unclassified Paraburkholderia TaxID=2615204 RepID=UPI003D1CD049
MVPNVARYVNKTVFVSIPALFEDRVCRPFTLLGVELHGLWLQSDELTDRLLPEEKRDLVTKASMVVFVPFAQIAGVLVATGPAPDQQQPENVSSDAARHKRTHTRKG